MLSAGFVDPVSSAQSTFRAILAATARPGTVWPLEASLSPPAPLTRGAGAVALTLCDRGTPIWLDPPLRAADAIGEWLRFHCAAKIVEQAEAASFAFAADPAALPAFERFNLGTADFPDRSTTIVLSIDSFEIGPALILEGPGICDRQRFCASPLPRDMRERLALNRGLFPRGVDLLLVAAERIAALPRSVRLLNEDDGRCT